MRLYRHLPAPPLDIFIAWCWYYVDLEPDHNREHVLPDGGFDLIINLKAEPRKLYDRRNQNQHQTFRRGWLSGAHSDYLVIDALPGSSMIGIHFKPGGAAPFLGLPAGEFTGAVVELDAIWGAGVWDWRDRLLAAITPSAKFRVLEELLLSRLKASRPDLKSARGVAWALARFAREPGFHAIREVADTVGMSHKHFITSFRNEVGLTPKRFCRIRRFQDVLQRIHSRQTVLWTDIVYACGYYDQAHFVHDFAAFAGVNPSTYLDRRLGGDDPNFIRAPL